MIKKIVYIVLIILGVLFTVGYFRYNPAVNIVNVVPVSADVVVRFNLREIEYNIIKNAIKHPFSFFKSTNKTIKKSTNSESEFSLLDEVVIPANLFFYTNHSNLKNTWISSAVKIKNKDNLQAFFKQEKFIKKNINDIDYFTRKNSVYVVKNDELSMLFSFGKTIKIEENLNFVFQTRTYLTEKDNVLCKLINNNQLIAVATKKDDFFELGIGSKKLQINGELGKKYNLFLPYKAGDKTNSTAFISGKINKQLLFSFVNKDQKDKFKKATNLSLEAIKKYWNGELQVNLESFISKNEIITTYEYDDDFNKVEKTIIKNNIIPDVSLRLGGGVFADYLCSKGAIKNINGDSLLVMNPFFKTYSSRRKNSLFLSSKNPVIDDFEISQKNKFLLFFDIEKYIKVQENSYSIPHKYLTLIKKVKVVVTNENKVALRVDLKDTPQSFLYQLLK